MKRKITYAACFAAVLLTVLFSALCVPVAKAYSGEAEDSGVFAAERDESLPETAEQNAAGYQEADNVGENGIYSAISAFVLAGTVIGAMVIVTVLYKKRDETKYL